MNTNTIVITSKDVQNIFKDGDVYILNLSNASVQISSEAMRTLKAVEMTGGSGVVGEMEKIIASKHSNPKKPFDAEK